jgi:predicted lipid-binding transport protein (Tim44 family)
MAHSRRTLTLLALAAALAAGLLAGLVLADLASAAAGGGSSGFSGGGGGGGGGGGFSGGGGSSFGGSGSGSGSGGGLFLTLLIVGFVVLVLSAGLIVRVVRRARTETTAARSAYRRRGRVKRVGAAAAEAAGDDAAFDPEEVKDSAYALFMEAQRAWDGRDRKRLAELVGADLLSEWNRRLDDFDRKGWHNRVNVLEGPVIEYVGLTNRESDEEDRAVVHIEAKLEDYVVSRSGGEISRTGESGKTTKLREYWTLAKRDGRWIVASIEQQAEGEHHLDSELVASPWSDGRLRDEAIAETAAADGLPEGWKPADVADLDFDGDARAAALDLALADPRFSPDVLEAAARGVVEAWADAVDGDDGPLEAVASPEAVAELLYPEASSRKHRLVVRGPRVRQIKVAALDAAADPATMTIDVELAGRRFIEDRDTAAVVSGSKDRPTTFSETWTLGLDGEGKNPWRLIRTGAAQTAA